jgi:hypothetical protein
MGVQRAKIHTIDTLKTIRFWGTKQKIERRAIKKRKILFVIPNKVSIFAPVK